MALGDSTFIPLDPAIFNDNNELTGLKSYILRQLGWPSIRVEITEDQLIDCIIDAVTIYHEYVAGDYEVRVIPQTGGNIFDIPEDINSKFIVDIIFKKDYFDALSAGLGLSDFDSMFGGVLPFNKIVTEVTSGSFDIAQYYMYLQYMEDFKKIVGTNRSFQIIGHKIHVYPAYKEYGEIGILFKPMVTEREAEQSMWIKKYATAKAKLIVGTVRSKLSGFSSTGANISADGSELKSEAREDIDKLEEKLQTMGIPMPIMQC